MEGPSPEVDELRREIGSLRTRLLSAEAEKRRLTALVESSPVGVMVVDAATRTFASVNKEDERILGMSPEPGSTLVRYHELAIYSRTDGKQYEDDDRPLARALGRGDVVRAEEILLNRPDGRTLTILVNATPIYSDDGSIVSAVAVIQDMTPLEEMERMRNDFLAMVSHELRGPLTTIKGSAATVLSTTRPFSPAETRSFFRTIDQQTDLLSDLVSNLLDVTRIEAGALVVDPQPTDVNDLVEEAVNTFRRGGSQHQIQVDLPPDIPPISADSQRVAQVLNNLLSNASKYSPQSSAIEVTASLQEPYLAVSVIDEGQGVTADQLPRLFRKFSRAVLAESSENIEGHGLGLAICKGIVEAHGGRIWVESRGEGNGARFTFTIPVAHDAEGEIPESSTRGMRMTSAGEQTRVLSIDDDPQILRYLRNTLSDAGYLPIATGNPNEMLHLFEMERPHLVLLDVRLPGTSGFELLKSLREISEVPVIFLSGSSGEVTIARGLELGASDYIVKPFSPTELIARIETALRKGTGSDAREEREPYRTGDLTIDYSNHQVTVGDSPVQLTAIEYKVLFELSTNAGRVLTHEQILQRVWGEEYSGDEGHSVRVVIGNLRRKLGDDVKDPKYVFTERGVGYRMVKA
ncbi:MAG: ATP-binding protein [Chloroflexota bacterium]|nr:ATP-binding protein [Chloroflexota bacterium]